jgi:hypothetical protein
LRPSTLADVTAVSEAAGWRVFVRCALAGILLGGVAGAWLFWGVFATIGGPSHASATTGEFFVAALWPGFLVGAFAGAVAGAGLGAWLGVATSRAVRAELQGRFRDRAI